LAYSELFERPAGVSAKSSCGASPEVGFISEPVTFASLLGVPVPNFRNLESLRLLASYKLF